MKGVAAVCAMVAMFGLTAAKCTPEERAAVVNDYADRMQSAAPVDSVDIPQLPVPTASMAPVPSVGPTVTVDATCSTAHIVVAGFSPGQVFSVGFGAQPPRRIVADEAGGFEQAIEAGARYVNSPKGWSVDPEGVDGYWSGHVDCP